MARGKKPPLTVDWKRVLDVFGVDEFVRQGGLDQVMHEIGIDQLLARLTPEQRRELQRRLQETPPPGR